MHGQTGYTKSAEACCISPAAVCYWFAISLISWAILGLVGVYWHPLRAGAAQTILLAMAIGCFTNWINNRTFHCGITGPLFLIIAVLLLLSDTHIIHIGNAFVWPTVLLGSGIAFLLDWLYTSHAIEAARRKAKTRSTLDCSPDCIVIFMPSVHTRVRPTFQIGELAKRTARSIDAIRFYERRKLLPTPLRSTGRFRLYTTDDIERLRFIRQVRGLGFSLREIKELLAIRADSGHASAAVRHFLKTNLADVAVRIRKLKQLEMKLRADLRKCNRELKPGHGNTCTCPSGSKERTD